MLQFNSSKRKNSDEILKAEVIDHSISTNKRVRSDEDIDREKSNSLFVMPYIKRIPCISDADVDSFDVDFNSVNKVLRELEFVRRSRRAANSTTVPTSIISARSEECLISPHNPILRDECPP
jgi:hypothetical protein